MEKSDKEYMEKFWHTSAHVFAEALTSEYPTALIAIGPPIEQGFHYDFDLDYNLKESDLDKIEQKMNQILKRKDKMIQKNVSIDEAKKIFEKNKYKIEMINDLQANGEKEISTYTNGQFIDMCKGPHLDNVGEIGTIKLLKISSAYWKGNEKNKQLQRVYGIAFKTKQELNEWIELRKKAEENSNIKLGKELDLYMMSEKVGRGLPIWCPNGTMLRMQLQNFLIKEQQKRGYQFMITPHIGKSDLFSTSGHLAHYKDIMYAPIKIDDEEYYLKPMNCPFHIEYYAKTKRSYRELPLRISEMGTVYRYEKSGELSGLLRVRGFTQDDAHIFCTQEQVKQEFKGVFDLVMDVMNTLGLKNFRVRIGTRDPNSDKYVGPKEIWEKATQEIIDVVKEKNINFTIEEGDAAFYGPKADIVINDAIGREWQTGTIQLDYNLPDRFDLNYTGTDGKDHRPVMIHRAPFGSFERFTGIIIEHFGGKFPTWLSPVQAIIIPVSENFSEYAKEINSKLLDEEIRVKLDDRNETLGYRIREGQKEKVPYLIVAGAKEQENKTVTIRNRQNEQKTMTLDEFIDQVKKEIKEKTLN
ncbi:MAG: threonine--tRNA ligase [Candidatus ainarchaeum sp.]|nr:threonine--tRNA ligase [Candidatus ainarchaeum sp.]